jgi:hypothetical protein
MVRIQGKDSGKGFRVGIQGRIQGKDSGYAFRVRIWGKDSG